MQETQVRSPGLGRCPGGEHSTPLQYSCLGSTMERGAWWATVHGVAKIWTWLRWLKCKHGVFVDKENSGFRYTFATLRMRVLCYSPEQEAEETVSGGKNPWIQSGWKKSCFSVLPCGRRDSAGRGCHWLTPETICLETPQFTCWLILHPTSIESFCRFLKVVTNALYVPSIKTWSYGEGNGNPLQYSCPENAMDRGAWWATVHEIAKSQAWLSNSHTHTLFPEIPA